MSTGSKIKELREKHGMTQEELASQLGLKKAAVNKYETGRVVNLKRSTILKLCRIFDVMPQDLMDLGENPCKSTVLEDEAVASSGDLSSSLSEVIGLIKKLHPSEQIRLKEYLDSCLESEDEAVIKSGPPAGQTPAD